MAIKTKVMGTNSYSSTAKFSALLGKDGQSIATTTNPVPVDAVVTVDSMNINAEMSEATGHDYYVTTTNLGNDVSVIGFDDVSSFLVAAPLTLGEVIKIENKTQGWIYNTKGATVANTSIILVMANQEPGAPVPGATDKFEVIYRGTSRLTNKTQLSKITDGTNEVDVLIQDSAYGTTKKGLALFGKYEATPTTYTDGDATPILTDANGRVVLESDIQIGAVELKNGTTDDRAIIKDGSTFNTTDLALGVADANVLAALSAVAIPTTLTGGSLAVTTSGTALALGASLATKSIYIRAKSTNAGNVYVGDSNVDATTSQQIILAANDSVTIDIANRATVYVDAAVNGEGVDYLCSG